MDFTRERRPLVVESDQDSKQFQIWIRSRLNLLDCLQEIVGSFEREV